MAAEKLNPIREDIFEKRYDLIGNTFRTLSSGKAMVVIIEMSVREVPYHRYELVRIIVDLDVADVRMASGNTTTTPSPPPIG